MMASKYTVLFFIFGVNTKKFNLEGLRQWHSLTHKCCQAIKFRNRQNRLFISIHKNGDHSIIPKGVCRPSYKTIVLFDRLSPDCRTIEQIPRHLKFKWA